MRHPFSYSIDSDYPEAQQVKMKFSAATFLLVALVGCAHVEHRDFTAPSSIAVEKAIHSAQENATSVKQYVAPEGQKAFSQLTNSIAQAQDEVFKYRQQVDDQSVQLSKAISDANYWHEKQVKALKELWLWRSIALASILAVVAYIGLKTSWRFFL